MKKLVRLWKRPSRDGRRFTFVLVYRDEQGKKRFESLGHTDSRKAERQRAQKERELRMGFVEPSSIRLSELLDDYLRNTQGQVAPTTLAESERDMRELIAVVGDVRAEALEFRHGEQLIQHCLAKGNVPGTVNKKLRHLNRVLKLAAQRGLLEKNPIDGINKLKVTSKPVWAFNDDEVELLLEFAPNSLWLSRILVARSAGLRVGEILNLTWQDIDFTDEIVMVQPKEDTAGTWTWHPKDYEIRELPLGKRAVDILSRLRDECPSSQPYALLKPTTHTRMLQLRDQGKLSYDFRRLPEREYYKEFKKIRNAAKLNRGSMHDLRRAAITSWAENKDLQPHEAMKLAGHSSLSTTLKYYVHVRRSIVNRARSSTAAFDAPDLVARRLRAVI